MSLPESYITINGRFYDSSKLADWQAARVLNLLLAVPKLLEDQGLIPASPEWFEGHRRMMADIEEVIKDCEFTSPELEERICKEDEELLKALGAL